MADIAGALALGVAVLFPVAAFVRQWMQARRGSVGRTRAVFGFAALACLPAAAGVLAFLIAVGLEEATSAAIVSEGFARALPFVVGFNLLWALLLTLVLALLLRFFVTAPRGR